MPDDLETPSVGSEVDPVPENGASPSESESGGSDASAVSYVTLDQMQYDGIRSDLSSLVGFSFLCSVFSCFLAGSVLAVAFVRGFHRG